MEDGLRNRYTCKPITCFLLLGNLSRPVLTALPGFMVQYKNPVTILCQGPAQAEAYKIYKVGSLKSRDRLKSLVPRKDNSLTITEITADCTGLYQCSYHSSGLLSELSDPLQLVMIGEWDTEAEGWGGTSLQREEPGFEI